MMLDETGTPDILITSSDLTVFAKVSFNIILIVLLEY
jgi:hypothetical protein